MLCLLTAIGLPPAGSSTVHIYTQTIHRTTQNKQYIEQHKNFGRMRAVPFLCGYTLAFALQLMKKHGKTSVRTHETLPIKCQKVTKITTSLGRLRCHDVYTKFRINRVAPSEL
jgi:hypothetical protein